MRRISWSLMAYRIAVWVTIRTAGIDSSSASLRVFALTERHASSLGSVGVMADEPADEGNLPREQGPKKKRYQPPVLACWGTLEEMTQAVGNSGKNDGGRGRNKTR